MVLAYLVMFLVIIAVGIFFYFHEKKSIEKCQRELKNDLQILQKSQMKEELLNKEVVQLKKQLMQTFEDPVTKLLGWQAFENRLNQTIAESERYDFNLSVLSVDIADFKVINDALGYEAGDLLLQQVGDRLQRCIRKVDSASRISKDVFVILLTQLSKPEMAAVVAQRILQAMKEPFQLQRQEIFMTVNIGIAIYPNDGKNSSLLLRSAEQALNLAKLKGNQQYQFYQQKLHRQSQRELAIHTHLNQETIYNEFVIMFQPIVNINTQSILAMDALLNWQHQELGLINSQELFEYADKQRRLNVITEWFLENACKQFMRWRTFGFAPDYLGFPLYAHQLENTHFIYQLSKILQNNQFNPEWLLLEITHNATPVAASALEKAYNMLHYLGIKILINHFDTSFFTLSYLPNINVDYIKLSAELVQDIHLNKRTQSLVKSIVFLAHDFSMQVIAQGIQSEAQITLLKALGCELLQGQLLGEAIEANEIKEKVVPVLST